MNYHDIFDVRGEQYHRAMSRLPFAREQEFSAVVQAAQISPGMTVLDVPSGGGYVAGFLPAVELYGLESSKLFAEHAARGDHNVVLCSSDRYPIRNSSIDRVLSIAGLHHVKDKHTMFSEMRRVLKTAGLAVVADVAEDSPVRRFLDDFVGEYCETGHSGWYFSDSTVQDLQRAGLRVVRDQILSYDWLAPNAEELAKFCKLLFGMTGVSNATVLDGISEHLGLSEADGKARMAWQLRCFTCAIDSDDGRQ